MSTYTIAIGAAPSEARPSCRAFLVVSTLLFVASASVTAAWGLSMSHMAGLPMPGGWTMSMAWTPMCGQTWLGAALSFLGMWAVMMTAMMLPVLTPMLWRYRRSLSNAAPARRVGLLTALAGLAYFLAWVLPGAVLFPLGVALAEMGPLLPEASRAVPLAGGAVVLLAGGLQFTGWKARCLSGCRQPSPCSQGSSWETPGAAWRHGVHLAAHCGRCCGNLMVVLIVLGMMDLAAMAFVTTAIAAERVDPRGDRTARVVGIVVIAVGLALTARAILAL
ncbi:MAG: DUF2182 domain-containing protein [Pseudomonadota bacterium]